MMSELKVKVDDRARLVTAVLAASQWPAEEQAIAPHAVHAHAKQTHQFVAGFSDHPAVVGMNQSWLNGVELDQMFSAAARCQWPSFITSPRETLPNVLQIESWTRALAQFAKDTKIATAFWPQHEALWDASTAELRTIFPNNKMLTFINRITENPIKQTVNIMPNLVYPALSPILATSNQHYYLLLPPLKAWGESPPWPYSEDPGLVVALASRQLLAHAFAAELSQLKEEQAKIVIHAATTLCVEDMLDEFEGQAYLLRRSKEENLPTLTDAVEKMRDYVAQSGPKSITDLF